MKTKEELLKIFSAYLPYELEFIYNKDAHTKNNAWKLVGLAERPIFVGDFKALSTRKDYKHQINSTIELIKPILYSMEYLTKEIEHKGERFVGGLMLVSPDKEEWDKMICEMYKPFPQLPTEYIRVMHESLGEIISINPKNVGHLPYNIFIKLLEMNFNVFGLSDSEYVKKETLNQ